MQGEVDSSNILCFSYDPVCGNVYFLLGQDVFQFSGDLHWSDFGGTVKKDETLEKAAAREFVEETCGVVKFKEEAIGFCDAEEVERDLKDQRFAFSVKYQLANRARQTFVVEVPWQPEVCAKFQVTREALTEVQRSSVCSEVLKDHPGVSVGDKCYVNKDCFEKHCLLWMSFSRIKQIIRQGGRTANFKFRYGFIATMKIVLERFSAVVERR